MRRLDTGADWAPNTSSYFCEQHANNGADVVIYYTPKHTGWVDTSVVIADTPVKRRTEIKRRQGVKIP
jgi:hypothetical protein